MVETGTYGTGWIPATTDYSAVNRANNTAAVWMALGMTFPGSDSVRAIVATNRMTPGVRITDGLSNTILISEASGRPARWQFGAMTQAQASSPATSPPYMNGPWAHHTNDIAVDGTNAAGSTLSATADVPTACRINCSNQGEIYAFHSGGAHACFGDGTVRFLSTGISLANLLKLCARNDGQAVELP